MNSSTPRWAAHGSTVLFVLLWSSGAIFARLALDYASPFIVLAARFALALAALSLLAFTRGRWPPARGTRLRVAFVGALIIGGYSICYLLALAHGVTPGVLASIMGVQPILTLLVSERRASPLRLLGLLVALAGLLLVVQPGFDRSHLAFAGIAFGCAALTSLTIGSILQKAIRESPQDVLPLQYAVGLALCALFLPSQPLHAALVPGFWLTLLWLALVISVVAQLLFYRLLQSGNLVSVTSLFYLVPPTTALLDNLVFGNALAPLRILGMATILTGLTLVFRTTHGRQKNS